ncbi:MAG: hypothetical protein AABW88_03980 [Nanoarchaeota archaeon]
MADDDYTLLSSKEVSELKQDMEYLKKNPLGGSHSGKTLQESIDKLNESISELIEIFKEASDMMKAEERESDIIISKISPIEKRLEELSDQNQKIAKGILAVADMVSDRERSRPQQPIQKPMQMMPPPMMRPQNAPRLPPMGGLPPPPGQSMSLPPLTPPRKEEKKGLFSFK